MVLLGSFASSPLIPIEVRRLIIQMAEMNVGWGAPRIHGELLKLGIEISEITVSRYMPERPTPAGSRQRWATFLRNHLHEILAVDFAVVPTATFGILSVFFVLSLDRRRVLHFNVTRHPTAEWTAQQVVEACAFDLPGRFLIRDNDKIYGMKFRNRVDGLGLRQIRTAFRSPWQNGFAERSVGNLRRDRLDHVIAINERQLRSVIRSYDEYYHDDRTHLGLEMNSPEQRPIEPREMGGSCNTARRWTAPSLLPRASKGCLGRIWTNDDGQGSDQSHNSEFVQSLARHRRKIDRSVAHRQ